MNAELALKSVVNKWNAIVETNNGFTPDHLLKIEEQEFKDRFVVTISNCNHTQVYSYKGDQSKEAIKQHVYECLLEQCIFALFAGQINDKIK